MRSATFFTGIRDTAMIGSLFCWKEHARTGLRSERASTSSWIRSKARARFTLRYRVAEASVHRVCRRRLGWVKSGESGKSISNGQGDSSNGLMGSRRTRATSYAKAMHRLGHGKANDGDDDMFGVRAFSA